jgi:hypothetical protein
MNEEPTFDVGDYVSKLRGDYSFEGVVVAAFNKARAVTWLRTATASCTSSAASIWGLRLDQRAHRMTARRGAGRARARRRR